MKNHIQNKRLWADISDMSASYPTISEHCHADVCIVGGGYTGLSAAIHLAEKGIRVCLLEAHSIGSGGSGRNVGLINAGTWNPPAHLEKVLGHLAGKKLNIALGNAPKLVFNLIDRLQLKVQENRNGNLQLAHNAKTTADIRERYRQLSALGADVALIERQNCEALIGTKQAELALLDKRAGNLNPYAYVQSLAIAADQLGVKIYENSPVVQLHQQQENGMQQWEIKTNQGYSVIAPKVILATNAYTEGEWTKIKQTMFRVNYYQIASEPLESAAAQKILPQKQGVTDTRTVLSCFRRDKDNRLLLGTVGSHIGKPTWLMPAWADRVASFYFPELGKINWQYQWSGHFGFTLDHLFRAFEPAKGIITATAFNGRGITTGTLMGKAFADYLLSDNADDLPLPLSRFADNIQKFSRIRESMYETGVTLYHVGQCLRIII